MKDTSYLSGKVWKRVLPTFDAAPPPGTTGPLRMRLPQGELAQFYDDPQGIHYLAFIELKEGTKRGNHFHRIKEEYIYLLSGELVLVVEDLDSKVRESIAVTAGELVFISTGIAHVLRIVKSGQAIEFSKSQFNPQDTFRHALE